MIITKQWNRDVALRRTAPRELRPAAHEAYLWRDLALARRVQQSLLPTLTPPPGLTAAACFHPAQAVGGDTYDLLWEASPEDMFATAVCVVIDPQDGSAAAAVAGHPPPLYWDHARGSLVPVSGHGPALGLEPEWRGPLERWRLAPEDALILYTDDVLDAKWNEQERLGEARLAELLSRTAPAGVGEWVDRLWNALDGCLALPDDVTIVAIGRELSRIRHMAPVGPRPGI